MFFLIKSCRLCRSYDNIYLTLNHIDSDNLTLFQKLNRITPGILEPNANLPNGICINCIIELNNAHKFITKCSESQAIFQRYLEEQLQNGQDVQPVKKQEILIKAIKLDESNCNLPNSVTVEDENETEFLNVEINSTYDDSEFTQVQFEDDINIEEADMEQILTNLKQENIANNQEILIKAIKLEESNNIVSVQDENVTGFLNEAPNCTYDDSTSNQVNFEDDIKIEEVDMKYILENLKWENIEASYNNSSDGIQTKQRGKENDDLFRSIEEVEHVDEDYASESTTTTTRDHSDFAECDVANGPAKVISKEHQKNVDEVLERGENSSKVNISIQPNYKCKICDRAYKHKLDLTKHKRTCTGRKPNKPYQCAICGRATVFKSALVIHMRSHTNEKPFRCEICSKAFRQSSHLEQHMHIHTNEKPYKCETCKKAFIRFSNLQQHIRIHTNEKPFKCETCKKAYTQSSTLKQHIRIHTNEKPYKCETCKKAFSRSSSLKRHIRIHTNAKPFKCETCKKAFNQFSTLKQHIRIHTNEKPFKCDMCNKEFNHPFKLKLHMRLYTNKKH